MKQKYNKIIDKTSSISSGGRYYNKYFYIATI